MTSISISILHVVSFAIITRCCRTSCTTMHYYYSSVYRTSLCVLQFRLPATRDLALQGSPTSDLSKLTDDCSEASSSPTCLTAALYQSLSCHLETPPLSCMQHKVQNNKSAATRSCTCLAPSVFWAPDWDGRLLNARHLEEVKFAAERVPHAQPWRLVAKCRRRLLTTAWSAPRTRITQARNPERPC